MEHIVQTMSLPGAALVVAHGYDLPRIESVPGDRFQFSFNDPTGKVAALLETYFVGASVSARDYYRGLQDLRYAINRAKHTNGGDK